MMTIPLRKRPKALHSAIDMFECFVRITFCEWLWLWICVHHQYVYIYIHSAWISVIVWYMCFRWMHMRNVEHVHFMSIKYYDHCWWFLFTIQYSATIQIFLQCYHQCIVYNASYARLLACSHIVWIVIFIRMPGFCIPSNFC